MQGTGKGKGTSRHGNAKVPEAKAPKKAPNAKTPKAKAPEATAPKANAPKATAPKAKAPKATASAKPTKRVANERVLAEHGHSLMADTCGFFETMLAAKNQLCRTSQHLNSITRVTTAHRSRCLYVLELYCNCSAWAAPSKVLLQRVFAFVLEMLLICWMPNSGGALEAND